MHGLETLKRLNDEATRRERAKAASVKRGGRRKRVTMLVTVSVPDWLPAADARREVRTLVSEQCNCRSDIDNNDVKAVSVRSAAKA